MSFDSDAAIIRWKTDAWKQTDMVAGYARRMDDRAGAVRIKNQVETDLIARFVRGDDLLDVGIGTGRASLPLARAGKKITGIDSSRAMLDKTKELAGSTPLRLLVGDLASLPFPDNTFDTVLALNTIAHFPHWEAIVAEWSRVVRPGGRLVFDIFSLDHDFAVGASRGMDAARARSELGPKEVNLYYTRASSEDLVAACNRLGLTIVATAPYGTLFGLSTLNHWLKGSLADGYSWDRLLSWANDDPRVLAFAVFLEEEILAHMGSAASGRFMVAIEKRSAQSENVSWFARNCEKNNALRKGISLELIPGMDGVLKNELRVQMDQHLAHERNRILLYRLLTAAIENRWNVEIASFISSATILDAMTSLLARDKLDRRVLDTIDALNQDEGIRRALALDDVDLSGIFDNDLMIRILDRGLKLFQVASD
jgi:SAM-dependent methyltransferase